MKDANAPKKPLSAFFRYAETMRAVLAEEGFVGKEAGAEMGRRWKTVPAEEKTRFQTEYQEEMALYKEARDAYRQTESYKQFKNFVEEKKEAKKNARPAPKKTARKRLRDPNAPKRFQTGYFMFVSAQRPILKAQGVNTHKELCQTVGAAWQALGESGRQVWLDKSSVAKAEYERQLEEYKTTEQYREFQAKLETMESAEPQEDIVEKAKEIKKAKADAKKAKAVAKKVSAKAKAAAKKEKLRAKKEAEREKKAKRKAAEKAKKQAKKEREMKKRLAKKEKEAKRKALAKAKKEALKAKKKAALEKAKAKKDALKAKKKAALEKAKAKKKNAAKKVSKKKKSVRKTSKKKKIAKRK